MTEQQTAPVEVLTATPRVAFVGLGFAARTLHLPGVRAAGGVPVAGVDLDDGRREEFGRDLGVPTYADVTEMLAAQEPDVVVVATPPSSHASVTQESLRAGAHVLCEKPFVETLEQADAVIATAAAERRHVAVNQEFRYMPIFRDLAAEVGSARSGRPVFLSCVQFMDLAPWEEKVAWRAAMPHRSLFEGGVHLIDLLHLVVGRLPRGVVAHTSSGLDETRNADAIHLVTLDYGGGLLAQLTIDRLCKAGTRYVDLRVDCEHESLRASHGGRALLQVGLKRAEKPGVRLDLGLGGLAWAERGLTRRRIARNGRDSAGQATSALVVDTFDRWRRGEAAAVTPAVARDTLSVILAAYESAQTGTRVEVMGRTPG